MAALHHADGHAGEIVSGRVGLFCKGMVALDGDTEREPPNLETLQFRVAFAVEGTDDEVGDVVEQVVYLFDGIVFDTDGDDLDDELRREAAGVVPKVGQDFDRPGVGGTDAHGARLGAGDLPGAVDHFPRFRKQAPGVSVHRFSRLGRDDAFVGSREQRKTDP